MDKVSSSGTCRYCGPECCYCKNAQKEQKAKHNLIYRIRKAGQGRVDTRAKMIYYFYQEKELVSTSKHTKLQRDYGFSIQSELVK